jgi:hypothetical protein
MRGSGKISTERYKIAQGDFPVGSRAGGKERQIISGGQGSFVLYKSGKLNKIEYLNNFGRIIIIYN